MQIPVFAPGDFVVTPSQRVARVVHCYRENTAENFQKAELEYTDNRERVRLRASHLNFYSGKYPSHAEFEPDGRQKDTQFTHIHIPLSAFGPPPAIDWEANLTAMQGCMKEPGKALVGAMHLSAFKK